MSVKFKSGVTEKYLQNPQRDNSDGVKIFQAQGRAAGGKLYVYNKGITVETVELSFTELRQAEKDGLEAFFKLVKASLTQFEYTDHTGVTWNARFMNDELIFTEIDDLQASSGTFSPDGGSNYYPTTTRGDGFWAVDITLELEVIP